MKKKYTEDMIDIFVNPDKPEDPANPDDGAAKPVVTISEQDRALFRERHAFAKKEKEYSTAIETMKKEIEELKKTPVEDNSDDEILRKMNAIMNGEDPNDLSNDGEDDQNKPLTMADLQKFMADQKAEQDKELTATQQKNAEETAVKNFKTDIVGKLAELTKSAPILNTIGDQEEQADAIYSVIEEDYLEMVEEYGDEYAVKNLMTTETAADLYQKYLVEKTKTMLKSEGMLNLFQSLMQEVGGQPPRQDFNSARTLQNDHVSTSVTTGDDDDDAAMARAMAAI